MTKLCDFYGRNFFGASPIVRRRLDQGCGAASTAAMKERSRIAGKVGELGDFGLPIVVPIFE
nr:hypothetical protein Itr_chr08CG10090 [Ipomoea trifida]